MSATCFECGAPAHHQHHVIPQSRGGTRTVPLCGACHGKAHHHDGMMSTSALTREAMERRRKRLGWVGGEPPWGYQATDSGHLAINAAEQHAIARAIELRESGLSLRGVAKTLSDEGHKNRRGQPLRHATTVVRMLRAVKQPVLFGAPEA